MEMAQQKATEQPTIHILIDIPRHLDVDVDVDLLLI
jgi:hypothetical protein